MPWESRKNVDHKCCWGSPIWNILVCDSAGCLQFVACLHEDLVLVQCPCSPLGQTKWVPWQQCPGVVQLNSQHQLDTNCVCVCEYLKQHAKKLFRNIFRRMKVHLILPWFQKIKKIYMSIVPLQLFFIHLHESE